MPLKWILLEVKDRMGIDKAYENRIQGMYYAYEQIKQNGLADFEQELKFRQKFGVTLFNNKKELKKFSDTIIDRSMKVILVFAVAVLHDEFGFGKKRCQQFIERFNIKTACLADDYLTWDDQVKVIEEEIGIHVEFK